MKELELKYGCNPNQKPARIFMDAGRAAHRGAQRPAGLYQLPGCLQLLAARARAQGGDRLSGGGLLQACLARRRRAGLSAERHREGHLLCRGRAVAHRLRIRPRPRRRPPVLLRRLGSTVRRVRRRHRAPAGRRGIRRHHRARLHRRSLWPSSRPSARAATTSSRSTPSYEPKPIERRDVFGITFEQGHNDLKIDAGMLDNIVTDNKASDRRGQARYDRVALITLKYTQSNSVCYVKNGQTIGVGAGQQSRIHCTRLAGQKADNWYLRQHPKVMGLQFVDGIRRPGPRQRDRRLHLGRVRGRPGGRRLAEYLSRSSPRC